MDKYFEIEKGCKLYDDYLSGMRILKNYARFTISFPVHTK